MLSQHQGRNYSNLSTWENNLKSEMLLLYATMNSHVDGNKSPKTKKVVQRLNIKLMECQLIHERPH